MCSTKDIYSHYSYRKRDIEHLLSLTDSFTWEELPTRDPDTGYLTKAGYIPIIQTLATYIPAPTWVFHIIQSTEYHAHGVVPRHGFHYVVTFRRVSDPSI
jgi:hypothetical protein